MKIQYYSKGKRENNTSLSPNNKISGCVTLVTCSWYNWNCGAVNVLSTTTEGMCGYPSWTPCYGATWEVNHSESETRCGPDEVDPNVPGIPTPMVVERDPSLLSKYTFIAPSVKIENIKEYLKCFKVSPYSIKRTVTVYVDQPKENSVLAINPFAQGNHFVGHVFIELTKEHYYSPRSSQNSLPDIRRVIGFYPSGNATPLNPKSPGALGDDSGYNGSLNVVASFSASTQEFNDVLEMVESYANMEYDINTRNCGNFASDVLSKIGVNIPNAWQQSFWYNMSPTGR